jgi:hypothetical protein
MSDDPLPAIRLSLFGGTQIVPIPIPGEARACNPSIAINGRGFCAIVRVVNYELSDAGVLISLPGGREVSSNWLVEFDRNLNATASSRIDDEAARTGEQAFPGGFEDGRLFRWKSAWWFSATVVVDFAPVRAKIVLCRLADQRVTECYLMESPLGAAIEKNWMPFVDQDALGWIYRISPTQLMRHRDGEAPRYEQIGESGPLDGWFGSSQCVRYRGRWICVVHRRRHRPESVFYEHRFVELTDDFRIRRVSSGWMFESPVVEFCAGLCISGRSVILSYGVLDRHARLMRIKLRHVERMLRSDLISRLLTKASQNFGRWKKERNLNKGAPVS